MALDSVPPYPSDFGSSRAVRTQQRIRKDERIWTADTYAPYDDGHQWRKYGEKKLSSSNFPRFYYRCTYKNEMKCPATKQVQQKDTSDPPLFSVTYFNHHTCSTISNPTGSTSRDIAAQSSSKKVVSICFSPHTSSEQPTFLTSSATPPSTSIHSYRANQRPDRNAYARQFQWTGALSPTSNGPVKMEADEFSGASTSSSSTGALPRTLLRIGQSRCIEYFHFL
ncbi:probable WRKY transcription factor 14 [Phragmites australis]|uniref:probable WRKY transcription factor 14 n=1 Tax=Phragmites australis TaxID=29695 RepID=UPI002D772528|nr:probable WRKY transcription factor 14 [Phragmites australis]